MIKMLLFKILTFILIYLSKELINAVNVNAVTYSYRDSPQEINKLADMFNHYAKENNLDITLQLTVFTSVNSEIGNSAVNYNTIVESFLNKKSSKYDLYFYDSAYSAKFGNHFINLFEYLPNEYINMYNSDIISNTCVYNNHLIGLPIILSYDVLYANKAFLAKYNKNIPKTWDELLSTAKYILEEEKKLNNAELLAYNGLFPYDKTGSSSIYEFIYSFRESVYDGFPEFTSQAAHDALVKLKQIKDEIASDEIFSSDSNFSVSNIFMGKCLFAKFYNIAGIDQNYYLAPLPGKREGISSSAITGDYLGISKYISEDHKNAAIEVLKFLISKETQKGLLMENKNNYPTISSLLDDEEVCSQIDCKLLRNIQPVFMPITKDFDSFESVLRDSTYNYLYYNEPVDQSLQKIANYMRRESSGSIDDSDLKSSHDSFIDFDINDDDYEMEKASDECKAETQKSVACLRKIESELNSKTEYFADLNFENVCMPSNNGTTVEQCKTTVKQAYDTVCNVFDDDVCKDFIADNNVVNLINSSKCEKSEYDVSLLGKIAAVKSAYLMGCKKRKSGELCPLGQYATTTAIDFAFNNFKTIEKLANQRYERNNNNEFEAALDFGNDVLTVAEALEDLNKVLEDSCNDNTCNSNIIALDKMILAAKAAYEKNQKVDLTKQFPVIFEFYNNYLDNFRNQKCQKVGFSIEENSGSSTLKKITYTFVSMMIASILLLL